MHAGLNLLLGDGLLFIDVVMMLVRPGPVADAPFGGCGPGLLLFGAKLAPTLPSAGQRGVPA